MAGMLQDFRLEPMADVHRDAVLEIARDLVTSADTYAFEPDVTDDALWAYWAPVKRGQGVVALDGDDRVVGMFVLKPNQPGPGSHIANGSYAVRGDCRGRGLGKFMGRASLDWARRLGFSAMQFNIVLANNTAAVRAWRSLDFEIMGTIPNGFRLPDGSFVDFHIMFRSL
jgi:GNAT superfamily N-acetyltransferase